MLFLKGHERFAVRAVDARLVLPAHHEVVAALLALFHREGLTNDGHLR